MMSGTLSPIGDRGRVEHGERNMKAGKTLSSREEKVNTKKPLLAEKAKKNMSLGGKGVPIDTPLRRVDEKLAKMTS